MLSRKWLEDDFNLCCVAPQGGANTVVTPTPNTKSQFVGLDIWEKESFSERVREHLNELLEDQPEFCLTLPLGSWEKQRLYLSWLKCLRTCAQCPTPMSDFKSQELDISGRQGMRELVFTSVKIHRALVSRRNHRDQVAGQVWTRTIRMQLRLFRNMHFTVWFGWVWRWIYYGH